MPAATCYGAGAIQRRAILLVPMAVLVLAACTAHAADEIVDVPWPHQFEEGGNRLIVFQPQADSWVDYRRLHFRCAISVDGVLKDEKVGVADVEAVTAVDHVARLVAITPLRRTLRFPNVSAEESAALQAAVEKLHPSSRVTVIALDRVLACLDASKQQLQRRTEVSLAPPRIYYSAEPAILVMFMGKPRFQPVVASKPNLQYALNTNWDVLLDAAAKRYYLLDGDGWITTSDPLQGPWTPTRDLPDGIDQLPSDENWAEVRKSIPGTPAEAAPQVFVATEPAELIVTHGPPVLQPIRQTLLSRVTNSESILFSHAGMRKFYFLAAGRWFSADALSGPWAAASKSLPPDFADIPDGDPSAFVKASVPGTVEAQDAVLLASVPSTTVVKLDEKPVQVIYSGQPRFVAIDGTQVQYAVNTSSSVFLAGGRYYCCDQGVWFAAAGAAGPWSFCTSVPAEIYTIPPSNPHYNVTYVVVQSSTPSTVTYVQTSGYSGEYVAATGVLMFGAGMVLGAALANDDHYYPYPSHYSYGCGAVYNHGYGGYYSASYARYGPYGGAGHTAAYNPATGTYARSSYAYGPAGSVRTQAAYNPYCGAPAAGAQVNTAYGSAGRGAAYNPSTGNYARGAYAAGQYGSAAAIGTSQGGAAAWNTQNSQGAVAKTKSGNYYAGNGDTVYKRDTDGNWSSNSGNGWENTSKPQPSAAGQPRPGATPYESQAQARQRGEQSAQQASQWKTSGASRSSASTYSGGSRSGASRSGGSRGGRR